MALVLDVRYRDKPVRYFYASRLLRLLPAYWFISIATIAAIWMLVAEGARFYPLIEPLSAWRQFSTTTLSLPIATYLAVSLITLLGADTWLWLGFNANDGRLSVAPDYAPGATTGLTFAVVPQAWTIGVEMLFYMLEPLLVA